MKGTNGQMQCRTYSVEEAAALLGIGRNTVYAAIRQGNFPTPVIRVGKRCVIPAVALDQLLNQTVAG